MKISSMIISMLLVSLFVTVFGAYFAGINDSYGQTLPAYTNATLSEFDHFDEISATAADLNNTLFGTPSGESGITDLVGKFLGSGFNALKISRQSFDAFTSLISTSASAIPGLNGAFAPILITIALIIVLFIIIRVLVGTDV
jgi:hypothetical protein